MDNSLKFIIKGAGEMASGIAWRLHRSGFRHIVMLETREPMAIRREVCFSEAVYDQSKTVDGITAALAKTESETFTINSRGNIAVFIDPQWQLISRIQPDVVIDAILAKKNLGTKLNDAPLVIGAGPGFTANLDVDAVIETNRGAKLGQVIYEGSAQPNTSIPQQVMGYTRERVLYAGTNGLFNTRKHLGESVSKNEIIATVGNKQIRTAISGILRGLIRNDIEVKSHTKIGDIEPRPNVDITKVSDKALAIGGGILEAVLARYNTL